jgi:adenylosuccinate lyase
MLEVDHERLNKNIEMTRDSIIAEPLYIILGLHGCPDPYDWSKKLVNASRESGKKMTELLEAEPALQQYYSKFTPQERELMNRPELYIGNADQVTLDTCKYWLDRLSKLTTKTPIKS